MKGEGMKMDNYNYLNKLRTMRDELHQRFIRTGELTGRDIDALNREIWETQNTNQGI